MSIRGDHVVNVNGQPEGSIHDHNQHNEAAGPMAVMLTPPTHHARLLGADVVKDAYREDTDEEDRQDVGENEQRGVDHLSLLITDKNTVID